MLKSFFIKNFRLFQELKINDLKRVNLIVGRNNSGKSALLEAIELYGRGASPRMVLDLLNVRQENLKETSQDINDTVFINPVRHLFYNHKLPHPGGEGISLGPISPTIDLLHIQISAYRVEEDMQGEIRTLLVHPKELPNDLTDYELVLVAVEGNKVWRVLRLERELASEARSIPRPGVVAGVNEKYITQFVPTRNMTEGKIASLWDSIVLTDIEDEVLMGLQLLEPGITGITFVEGSERFRDRDRIPLIKLKEMQERLPLRSLGDGAVRLFHILVALVNAKNGILLIDEFENGLHWSVQTNLWDKIFYLSERLNVQVFATTHSRDCVKSFGEVWKKQENLGKFFRLNANQKGNMNITNYSCETLSDALESDVEVR